MRPGARIAAAIEVVDDILNRHRPAADALADWGKAHRFAGAGDRAAIGNVVFDVLRRRASLAARMGADTPRALVLAAAPVALGLAVADLAVHVDGDGHAPPALTADEQAALLAPRSAALPDHVHADVPEWLFPSFVQAFGDRAVAEGEALATRAPVDLRANRLKSDPERVAKALAAFAPRPTAFAPDGLRIDARQGAARTPNVEADPAHGKGWFEVQDEGSQIAAALAAAGPRQQILDLCAGAGGKTLALASEMRNTGQIFAYDSDKHQLRPIFDRLKRAGVRNAQIVPPGDAAALAALGPRFDVVLVDAPCTGSGTWRRRPDAKWRVRPDALERRQQEQTAVLDLARPLVKPGGRLVYVTCSVLPEENEDRVGGFLARAPEFASVPWEPLWSERLKAPPPVGTAAGSGLRLTPAVHGTDGFFIAILERRAAA